ncbi:Hypothetical protein D9617_15g042930 [Elsinoe fawcettii]|nr:Hypothetical protein D9617_15g042930 [Elsinoe fawcettii]
MYAYKNNACASPSNRQSYSCGGSPAVTYAAGIDPSQLIHNSSYLQPPYQLQDASVPQSQPQPEFSIQDYAPRGAAPRTSPAQTTPPLLGQPGWDPNAQYYYISPASSGCRGSPQGPPVINTTAASSDANRHLHPNLSTTTAAGARLQATQSPHSTNVLSAEAIARYGYPTNRGLPTGMTGQSMSATAAANAHLMPLADPQQSAPLPYQTVNFTPRARSREASPNYLLGGSSEFPTPESVQSASFAPTLLSYLSIPGPMIDPRLVEGDGANNLKPLWIDVRNIRQWSDFNLSTMLSHPQVKSALNITAALSTPVAPSGYGMPNRDLLHATASHLCIRVNSALQLAQGQPHLAIRTLKEAGRSHFQPDFVSSYEDDDDMTIFGDGRGRVVGILKASNVWQSRWKRGSVFLQKKYLLGLADLHQAMRDHSCRYGFILSEAELVCVRYRCKSSNHKMPYFGSLELSDPIPMSALAQTLQQGPQLSAALALFYLHMLAKKGGLEGQLHWKLDVGRPEECTRQNYEKRDSWMPEILKEDERKMKNSRGWTYPKDKLNKKERELGRAARRNRRR